MHRFAIVKHDNPQIFFNFFYSTPFFDPSIGLYFNFCWFLNNCLDPIVFDLSAIRAFSCIIKILRGFHLSKSNQIIDAEPAVIMQLCLSFQIFKLIKLSKIKTFAIFSNCFCPDALYPFQIRLFFFCQKIYRGQRQHALIFISLLMVEFLPKSNKSGQINQFYMNM